MLFTALWQMISYLCKRAYITPADEPGNIRWVDGLESIDDPIINIQLTNAGNNLCNNVKFLVLAYNSTIISGESDVLFPLYTHMSNPVPRSGKLFLRVTQNQLSNDGITQMHVLATAIVVMKIEYMDIILQKPYEDTFYWELGTDSNLEEINPQTLDKIRPVIQEDLLRLWK
ncbi:MAG: hypothetical protein HQ556_13720 [Candidatus Marinimicrobia bacterium]|nr:hypothetical protein [Candidatus Neomarinimicrobiota bacterium]